MVDLLVAMLLGGGQVPTPNAAARPSAGPSVTGAADGAYKLVWSDEFRKQGKPDPKNWGFELGFVRNHEAQYYQSANASVTEGGLIIEGRKEHVPNATFDPTSKDWRHNRAAAEYTSACLETRNLHAWTYGRFLVKAKIDPEDGLWPAIWLLGNGPWPENGEIDMLEYYQNTILANTCWGDGTWNSVKTPYSRFTARDPLWATKFHIWRMDWDANFIRLYLDNQLLNTTDLSKTINPDGSNPFHQPHFLLLNLALGATGGSLTQTPFPNRFEIQYVRVYQAVPGAGGFQPSTGRQVRPAKNVP